MKKTILISFLTAFTASARADQCAYITKPQAEKAVKLLIDAHKVQYLCEPCGGTETQSIQADSLGFRKINNQSSEVVINGIGIDLAYTYINGLNLAHLVGCATEDVSLTIGK